MDKPFPELLVHWMTDRQIGTKALAEKATRKDGSKMDEATITRIRSAFLKKDKLVQKVHNPTSATRLALIAALDLTPEEFALDAPPYRVQPEKDEPKLHVFELKELQVFLESPEARYKGVKLSERQKEALMRMADTWVESGPERQ
jgi:hypothetical protein